MAAVFSTTADTSEAIDLYVDGGLYLKPISKMKIVVSLPEFKLPGLTISNWEVMEKLKSGIAPEVFSVIKVKKSSLETIHFDGETDSKTLLTKLVNKLNGKHIKLSGCPEPLKVRAASQKPDFPKKHDWNSYFRDATGIDERMPGERPDTIHLTNLPTKWFIDQNDNVDAFENVLRKVFERFGVVRALDIPCCDPYRPRMRVSGSTETQDGFKTFSFGSNLHFDAFVQFKEYTGFLAAMDAFRGMKLMKLMDDKSTAATANIGVDFDRTAHLSLKKIKQRDEERSRIIAHDRKVEEDRLQAELDELERQKQIAEMKLQRELDAAKEAEEKRQLKERRKRKREEKRIKKEEKAKKRRKEQEERKLFTEETRKSIEAQRNVEAERLLKVLIERLTVKIKMQEEEKARRDAELEMRRQIEEKKRKIEEERERQKTLMKQKQVASNQHELELRDKLISKLHEIELSKSRSKRGIESNDNHPKTKKIKKKHNKDR